MPRETEEVRSTQMERVLNELDSVANYLDGQVSRLENRLVHVRSSAPKSTSGEAKSLSSSVPLVQKIEKLIASIGASANRVEALCGELEI